MRSPYNFRKGRRGFVKKSRSIASKTIPPKDPSPRLTPRPVPAFNNRFSAALSRFGAALLETSEIANSGIKGTKREDEFRHFLAERLPSRYAIASGEAVDLLNETGPQLDVLIFDQSRNFSFSGGDQNIQILPAEALLASIEVKSKLDASEVANSCSAARRLRNLKPYKKQLAGRDVGSNATTGQARYLHCVFAYDTDLSESNWLEHESRRFHSQGTKDSHLIDSVYVLRRGLLNFSSNRGRLEDSKGGAITSFYFSILNFIQRESARRPETPYPEYASLLSGEWVSLGPHQATETDL
jgi:hypothetical protein